MDVKKYLEWLSYCSATLNSYREDVSPSSRNSKLEVQIMQAYLYGVRRIDMKDDNGGQINGYSCFIGYPADGVIGDEVSKVFVSDSMVKKCTWSPEVGKLVNVEFTPKGNAFMAYLAADSSFVPESDYVSTLPASVISSDGEQIFPFIHEITREPLNNSLYPVSTQFMSRHFRLVKVISAQNSHYLSAFLLLFLKKGRLPLC